MLVIAVVDIRVARILVLLEQRGRRHDHAALAVAALRHLQLHPGLLHRMRAVLRQRLDGGDLLALHRGDRHHAGARRLPVHVHRAGAAHRDAATVLGSGQSQLVAQHPEQRHLRFDVDADRFPFTLSFAIGRFPRYREMRAAHRMGHTRKSSVRLDRTSRRTLESCARDRVAYAGLVSYARGSRVRFQAAVGREKSAGRIEPAPAAPDRQRR